jgi:hypothetical protein
MMRRGTGFNTSRQSKSPNTLGLVFVFAGLVSLAVYRATRVVIGSHFGKGTAVVSFLAGMLLLCLGLVILSRARKS